jgi:hypothetical protein
MEETRARGLCFGHNKWSKEHKCQERKLFTLENNDEEGVEAYTQINEEELIHTLVGLSSPQTLKIVG